MVSCESCRGQLLEYLYDLLDEADRRALDAHLTQCPACQAALVKARNQLQLLGAAAKTNFAGVRFDAPAAAAELPLAGPLSRTVVRTPAWTRWAMAAAVVVAVGGLGTLAALLVHGFVKADGIHADNSALVADLNLRNKEIQKDQS